MVYINKGDGVGLIEELEQDIDEYFQNVDEMLPEKKKKALILLFDKYLHLSTAPVKFSRSDFDMIKSGALPLYADRAWPKNIKNSYNGINTDEAPNMCIIESTINYLKMKDCLKKLPQFDYEES